MAQKFGNARWIKEGFLDNHIAGTVVGRITLAALGPVPVLLHGDFKEDIKGEIIVFENSNFEDDDRAGLGLVDLESVLRGTVHLISLDPHPLLEPHPYFEWFSAEGLHYRIELEGGIAPWILEQPHGHTGSIPIGRDHDGRIIDKPTVLDVGTKPIAIASTTFKIVLLEISRFLRETQLVKIVMHKVGPIKEIGDAGWLIM